MIRIGILSTAHGHANSYAASLRAIAGVDLVGVADDDAQRGRAFAERFGIRAFASPQALLAEGLDGVVICSANLHHRHLTELAAGRTRHILCEKPIATTVADAEAMIEACAREGAKLQIAFPVRFAPPVMRLRALLRSGALGEIYSLKATNYGQMPGGWFVDRALAGGGAVIDHTVHVIDLLRWFFDAEVSEVYAEVGDSLLHDGLGIDDAGLLSFTLSNGAYGTLDTSWSRPAAFPTWGDVTIEVVAERGWARLDAFKQQLAVYSNRASRAQWVGWGSDMDLGLMRDFVAMIAEGREPSISGRDGLKALEVALAAYQSAASGAPVRLT
ncbi:MAG TPA: Gfo/Idh/MocA family oxidoreductase [Roseiflexaceae bacterium]|nr:Gfo/Idh/MocA family oxidoreductase [Roseiflexaceae bacterium]